MSFKCQECDQVVSGSDIIWHQTECARTLKDTANCTTPKQKESDEAARPKDDSTEH